MIIVENGSEAIRGISDNGLVWKVDAASVPATEIVPGKVIFLTSRAVGKVLAVEREGDQLAIMLGPAERTQGQQQQASMAARTAFAHLWNSVGPRNSDTRVAAQMMEGQMPGY